MYWKTEHTLSIGYGITIQNKNTWLSRSRRSVENIIATFSEFLFQYFRFFVSFLLSSLDVKIVLLNFKEPTLKYSPRQNFVFDLESINWCDQIVEELSLIQSRIIVTEKLMVIPLLTVLYVGKTIMSRKTQKINDFEWEMFLFFICPQLVQTGQLLDSQCYSLSLEHPDFHETTRLPLGKLLNSPCYKRSQAPP